jgi:hypothetical protein
MTNGKWQMTNGNDVILWAEPTSVLPQNLDAPQGGLLDSNYIPTGLRRNLRPRDFPQDPRVRR